MSFNVTVLCMDKVNQLKTEHPDAFNNEAENTVTNTQLAVSNKLYKDLYSGQLRLDGYQVDEDASIEFFFDRFENILAGVAMTLTIQLNMSLVTTRVELLQLQARLLLLEMMLLRHPLLVLV